MFSAYIWSINHKNISLAGMIETGIFTVALSVEQARKFIEEVTPEYTELVQKEPDLITPYGTVAKLRSTIEPVSMEIKIK